MSEEAGWFAGWFIAQTDRLGAPTHKQLREQLAGVGVVVSDTTVTNWRTGKALPSAPHFAALCDLFVITDGDRRDASDRYLQQRAGRPVEVAAS